VGEFKNQRKDLHVKANMSIKRVMLANCMYSVCLTHGITPSEVVVVDLGSSHGKDFTSVIRVGCDPSHYIGFDVFPESVAEGNTMCRVDAAGRDQAIFECDLTAADAFGKIRAAMRQRGLARAHIVMCNFTIHHFPNDDALFALIDPGREDALTCTGCHVLCAICDSDGIRKLIDRAVGASNPSPGKGMPTSSLFVPAAAAARRDAAAASTDTMVCSAGPSRCVGEQRDLEPDTPFVNDGAETRQAADHSQRHGDIHAR